MTDLLPVLMFLSLVQLASSEPFSNADNVCNKTITVRKDILVDEPVHYEIKFQGMCGMMPCTKTRTETRMNSKLKSIVKDIQMPICCPGFTETLDRQCAPIDSNASAPASAKLEALSPRVIEGDLIEIESTKSVTSLVAAHMGINLFLILSTFVLVMAVFWYKKRLNQIKNELYYAYTRQAPSDDSSNYSPSSVAPSNYIHNRPPMPLPLDSNFLGKNLDFNSATRNILLQGEQKQQTEKRSAIVYDSEIESHLINSQVNAQQNLYTEVESVLGDRTLSICTNLSAVPEAGESIYQVPRSPSHVVSPHIQMDSTEEEEDYNIYEEIKPKSSK